VRILSTPQRLSVLHHLIEGNSIRSTERLTGVHRDTITKLLVLAGNEAGDFLYRGMRGLKLRHIQVDEIWTFVLVKQAHIPEERADDDQIGDQYVFVALDEHTKLIPTFLVGKRTGANAERFMLDLADRVTAPRPGHPKIKLQLSSDGFAAYPGAVDLAFANTVDYGVLIKSFAENQEQPGRYGPPEVTGTERRVMVGEIDPYSICTSHVERQNLTMRTFIRRFTRLSLGFSKKIENLVAAVCLHVAHYNYCRKHRTLKMSPAMAAGVTGELWSLERLVGEIGL
jgi:IS1 family transposase